ncbi:LysR family transcriptional regulator [Pseudomonas typographi]|uniref:LysR family transcriptional regulator n=1 Tax=Pseudomonas typographi TaxID=2715964 RepID=A0ABR7Z2H2_9PSED|nr:LysR family transcriptional regulator [Pseudomonas typographi]MBD1599689.1 LysR family transcriptional regulator [Pseudomonas typographi]
MNFTAFRYFNEVARSKAIRRAADRLHVTPSAVSRQISLLEHQFGAPLLERSKHGVELTAAGVMLERYTRTLFRNLERVQEGIAAFRSLDQGEVKVHAMEGVLSNFLPETIAAFLALHPRIDFRITTCSSDLIVEALIRDETDIGIIYNPELRFEIEVVAERKEPVMCLVAKHDELANEPSVSLQQLCKKPLALPRQSFGLRQLFDRTAESKLLKPRIVVEANNLEILRASAVLGTCVTIGPEIAARREIEAGLLKAVPIELESFKNVRSAVCVHQERVPSYASNAFLKFLKGRFPVGATV